MKIMQDPGMLVISLISLWSRCFSSDIAYSSGPKWAEMISMTRGGRGWPVCPWASKRVVMRCGSWGASPEQQVRTKELVKHHIISAKRNMFTVKAKPLLLSTFTLAVRINLLYWESCVLVQGLSLCSSSVAGIAVWVGMYSRGPQ